MGAPSASPSPASGGGSNPAPVCDHQATQFANYLLGFIEGQTQAFGKLDASVLIKEIERRVGLDRGRQRTIEHLERVLQRYIDFTEKIAHHAIEKPAEAAEDFLANMY